MQALLQRQFEIVNEIKKLNTNFKKDPKSRKTKEYIEKRIKDLDDLWLEFKSNNEQLSTLADKTHEYFTRDIFFVYEHLYSKTREMMTMYEYESKDETTKDNTTQVDLEKAKELLSLQRTNFRAFSRITENLDIENIEEKWELEYELRNLQNRWSNIEETHLKIDNILESSDLEYDKEYEEMEVKFKNMNRLLNKKVTSQNYVHLTTPKIEIPTFSGNYIQWSTFFDLFKEAVHNNPSMTKAQKMQHLKGKLRGEAERLIQHLHISSENYDSAWKILVHRYDNQQVLFTKHIETLINQPNIQKQSSTELKRLHDVSMECIHGVFNMGIDTSSWDPILVHLVAKKLDTTTYSDYMESRKAPRELPDLDEFMAFLEAKFTALEPMNRKEQIVETSNFNKNNHVSKFKQRYYQKPAIYENRDTSFKKSFYVNSKFIPTCPLCKQNHALFQCKRFEVMTPEMKLNTISKLHICENCLYVHKYECNSEKRCKECNKKHNTLLHDVYITKAANNASSANMTTTASKSQGTKPHVQSNHVAGNDDEILLATIKMQVRAADGSYITLRALLDQGSQTSLISENAAQRLGLKRQNFNASVTGIGTLPGKSRGKVLLHCKSLSTDYAFSTEALIMSKVINCLPVTSFENKNWPHIQHLQLADPEYNISKPIDILLDAKVYAEIIMDGLLKGSSCQPIAQQTQMGWILSGSTTKTFNCYFTINNIEDICNYWEMEDISEHERSLTLEEQFCEDYYIKTTKRLSSGVYEVRLPMKKGFERQLGHSKLKAVAQFKQLERKLEKDPQLCEKYNHFMNEYIAMNHMKPAVETKSPECYLPHHGVLKFDSNTTKLRAVFNASEKTSTGFSLNDLMECGPKLQRDILELLLSWRAYKYVYTADCEKMYRMIKVQEDDQQLQKIIWRNEQGAIQEFQLCTVTYGMKAAPYLALRTMQQLASDDADVYPIAAEILKKRFYVDDLIYGSNKIEEAKQAQRQLIDILRGGGFNLRKWSSNEPRLLEDLSNDQINVSTVNFNNSSSSSTKALGLRWHPSSDIFTFDNKIENSQKPDTKRSMLSNISKLFDPLGWLSPSTIKAKLLFQRLWSEHTEWNQLLSPDIQHEWSKLKEELKNISKIKIPRWVGNTQSSVQLHGFADASEKAYAAVVYIKTYNEHKEARIHLMAAKTKLAPQKKRITLPRLELCGAVLLSKLMQKVIVSMSLAQGKLQIHGWTDSMVVLGWIHGNTARWKTYVANRVNEIIKVIPSSCWRHTKSEYNAADCATRGLSPSQLLSYSLWWNGPSWLKENKEYPPEKYEAPEFELKTKPRICAAGTNHSPFISELLYKYSSVTKATRVLCRVLRFITNARERVRNNNNFYPSYITVNEIKYATKLIIKSIQLDNFAQEIEQLKRNGNVSRKSAIISLNPFLDKDGILRMKGRLQHSALPATSKQPIVLPYHSRLTDLLILDAHHTTLHGGVKLTLAHIRNKYWIISGQRAVKKIIHRCTTCVRLNTQKRTQIMGDLPTPRVVPSRPFTHTGVDFMGHVEVKANKGRGIKTTKGYIAVFICLTIKAVHLELVSDLTASAFLAAFKRMCARRGTPLHVYSDNGTNFVGASRVLQREYKQALQTINTDFLENISQLGVTWHFNVAAWSSAGGIWEAAVKSLKHHLKRVVGHQKLTFEEYSTLLTQIEACLNSRPLCSLTENPEDIDYLSPGHFLIGGPILSEPLSDINIENVKSRWQLTEQIYKEFWKRWSAEYLHTLQTRSKWHIPQKNIELDSIVVMKEDNLPPSNWALAKVIDVHPGKDGYVRAVTLKTKHGVLKRPITKLCPLPVLPDQDDNWLRADSDPGATGNTSKRSRSKANYLICLLLLIIAIISPSMQQTYKITQLESTKALYFDRAADLQIIERHWIVIVYYNMSTFWKNIQKVERYLNHLNSICNEESTCTATLTQFRHELDEIEHYNNMLKFAPRSRAIRGLFNGVGRLSNYLFGILDDQFAEKYSKDIKLIHQNEVHLQKLLKNQTTIIEAENNTIQRNEYIMNKQFTRIEEQIRNFSSEVQQVKQRAINIFYFTTHVVTLDVILSNLRRIQDTLINTVTNIYHGRLDVHLLSPAQLQEQLNVISRQVQGEFLVPVNVQNIKELFKMLQVKARITEDFVIIEVKVPLLSTDTYELNRVIPIPQTRNLNSIYVTPSTDYIAFNLRKDTFMSVMENDLQLCIRYNDVNLICPITSPLYELKVGQSICDVKIITDDSNQTYCRRETKECPDRWIKLHSRDTWLYTCCEECKIRILCPSGLATRSLRGSGLISIGQDCILKGDTFSIQGHRDYRSEIYTGNFDIERMANESILNSVINTSTNQLSFVAENHNNTFWKIKGQIQDLLNQSDEEISNEDIHHYVMIYILYFIVVAAIVTAVIYMYRRKLYYIPTARPAAAPAAPAPDSPPPRPTERRVLSGPRTQDKTTSTMFDKIIKFECKIDE